MLLNPRFRQWATPGFWDELWRQKRIPDSDASKAALANTSAAVTGGTISTENLSAPVAAPSYFDKTFVKPEYIGQNGQVNIGLVDKDIEQQSVRLDLLLGHETTQVPLDTGTPAPLGDAIETKKAQLKEELAIPEAVPILQSAVMPLVSDVWNSVEPLNY
ncbi:MAG: hypothetical protein Q9214_005294, partial [Letrouitia sp. 1 TL-2023]